MKRRNFIRIMGIGAGSMLLFSQLRGCHNEGIIQQPGWSSNDLNESDIRLKIIAYAMLCPNPHNKQPWLVELTGPSSFRLFVDQDRLLPETDPYFRQIHIGQGTFLEMLSIAASGFGYEVEVNYFPDGGYSNLELAKKAVASIELKQRADLEPDTLFSEILKRHSNKRVYNNIPLSDLEIEQLYNFNKNNFISRIHIEQSCQSKKELENILVQAMEIEILDRSRELETIRMFRFDDEEIKNNRDGFGLSQSGVNGFRKFMAENFILSRKDVENDPTEFGKQAVEVVKKQSVSTTCFAWLSTDSNERLDQILVGRDYCRLNLKTSAMGLVQHPMSQILQEYDGMLALQAEFKSKFNIKKNETVQMLFRIGRAEPTQHSPRRDVRAIVSTG